ncbi:MAG: hypothetical protein AMS17_09450 [Spirochaetes bacterium DG_61]|nr:MAG: hypothetical protein AMS17_09450 [Spirochaetes bacterium DG_61]
MEGHVSKVAEKHQPIYEIRDLKCSYGDAFTLLIPLLMIERGDSVGIIGPNGSGKSTLLRTLAFLQVPMGGSIRYRGRKLSSPQNVNTLSVTMLLQEPYLLKRSVFENIAYGLKTRGRRPDLTERVKHALVQVGLDPVKFARRRWYELSGGESQRVALAARLAIEPEVLILDEPTANVDRQSAFQIKEAIGLIRRKYGTTLIVASHDHLWLGQIATRNLEIYDGRVSETGGANLIQGHWQGCKEGLWEYRLSDGQRIYSINPPGEHAAALLHPSSIIVSNEHPEGMSARNILQGTVSAMHLEREPGKVRVEVMVSTLPFICSLTVQAVENLGIIPGKRVWVVFKASSLQWH